MFPRKAEKYSPEAVEALLNLPISDNNDCINLAVTVLTIFTALRIEDVHRIYCDRITRIPFIDSDPRHLNIILERTKNDIQGSGPVIGRTFKLPCLCSSGDSTRDNQRFIRSCRTNPAFECATTGCPYKVINTYYSVNQFLTFILYRYY